jgi:DNA replication and repair protein RecF
VVLSPRTTVLAGQNGQGKTNFLEACYLLTTLRPLRAQKIAELIRFGEDAAQVRGRFQLAGGVREVEISLRDGHRSARVDGKPVRDPDELFGGLAVVAFTPDDLSLVKGGPDGRRKLLDRAVQNRHPVQLSDARLYLRALKSRNELLRQGAGEELLQAFDPQLARLGAKIRWRREELLEEIRPHAARAFAEVARGEAAPKLVYQAAGRDSSGLGPEASRAGPDGLEEKLAQALRARLPRDRERGYTSVGPHADDLAIAIGTHAARVYASQGQSRALVLAFKIGEIENLRAAQGRAPLLLLDDVSSELDPERNAFLLRYLAGLRGQVLLTTTDAALVAAAAQPADAAEEDPKARFFQVREGRIDPASPPSGAVAEPPAAR